MKRPAAVAASMFFLFLVFAVLIVPSNAFLAVISVVLAGTGLVIWVRSKLAR